jgi:hypothetical protein
MEEGFALGRLTGVYAGWVMWMAISSLVTGVERKGLAGEVRLGIVRLGVRPY